MDETQQGPRCPICGGSTACGCTPRELYAWAERQTTLPGIATSATETVSAFLAARSPRRGPDPRQRALF